jgi:hypothetical protein
LKQEDRKTGRAAANARAGVLAASVLLVGIVGCGSKAAEGGVASSSASAKTDTWKQECSTWIAARNKDEDKVDALQSKANEDFAAVIDALAKEQEHLEPLAPTDPVLKQIADTYKEQLAAVVKAGREALDAKGDDKAMDNALARFKEKNQFRTLTWGQIVEHCAKVDRAP